MIHPGEAEDSKDEKSKHFKVRRTRGPMGDLAVSKVDHCSLYLVAITGLYGAREHFGDSSM